MKLKEAWKSKALELEFDIRSEDIILELSKKPIISNLDELMGLLTLRDPFKNELFIFKLKSSKNKVSSKKDIFECNLEIWYSLYLKFKSSTINSKFLSENFNLST